jgi:hypothetical protein
MLTTITELKAIKACGGRTEARPQWGSNKPPAMGIQGIITQSPKKILSDFLPCGQT